MKPEESKRKDIKRSEPKSMNSKTDKQQGKISELRRQFFKIIKINNLLARLIRKKMAQITNSRNMRGGITSF